MKKRILSAVLLCSMMLSFAACSDKPENPDTPEAAPDAAVTVAEEEAVETLAPPAASVGFNADNYKFRIFARPGMDKLYYFEEETGDILEDAVYGRCRRMSENYAVEIEFISQESDTYGIGAVTALTAGDDAYDLVVPHARFAFTNYGEGGLATDWKEIDSIELGREWWDQNAQKSLCIGNKIYTIVDDISTNAFSSAKCLYFNKKILTDNSIPLLYDEVREGSWTFSRLTEISRVVANDLNGDGNMTLADDQFGYITSHWGGPISVLWTGGQRVCTVDEDGLMVFTLNTERSNNIYDTYMAFLAEQCAFVNLQDDGTPLVDCFKEGRSAFLEASINASGYREADIEFGIIPNPKFDETESTYSSGVDAGCNAIIIPITVKDPELVGTIADIMAYDGYVNILPIFYDKVLKAKASRDDDSEEMLDLIRSVRLYDIGYFYMGDIPNAITSMGWYLCNNPKSAFATVVARNEKATNRALDKINEYYAD